jgi:hypothetical protein
MIGMTERERAVYEWLDAEQQRLGQMLVSYEAGKRRLCRVENGRRIDETEEEISSLKKIAQIGMQHSSAARSPCRRGGTSSVAERWAHMTRGRNKNRTAKASGGWKAPNKRKLVEVKKPPAALAIIIAEPAGPSLFWLYEVLRWWAPTVRLPR